MTSQTTVKPPFERELDRIAARVARIILKERPDLMLSHADATVITLKVSRSIGDAWPKLAALRATYRPIKSVRIMQEKLHA